ncbi:MAG: hypothetical protein WA840_20745 [Caulobacteraceae bacterium]
MHPLAPIRSLLIGAICALGLAGTAAADPPLWHVRAPGGARITLLRRQGFKVDGP